MASNKNELRTLIDLIKHKGGLTQADIADRAGYKRTYLSEALSKEEPPQKLITKLKLTFADILENGQIQTGVKMEGRETALKSTTAASRSITEKYIALLEKQTEGFSSSDMQEWLIILRAGQRTIMRYLARVVAKVERTELDGVEAEMGIDLTDSVKEIRQRDMHGA